MQRFNALLATAIATVIFSVPAHAQRQPHAVAVKAEMSTSNTGTFDRRAEVAGRKLTLNGSGTRYRAVFKVYQAGLYLETPARRFEDITQTPAAAKRIRLVMERTVAADELGKLFMRGIQENVDRARATRLMSPMMQMSALFSEYKSLEAGDEILLDWVPGVGTVITVKGKRAQGAITEPEFFNALAGIWLGSNPADWKLRDAMLGIESANPTGALAGTY